MKSVYLEWEDVVSANPWMNATEVSHWTTEKWIVSQIGFIYQETKDHITLCTGYHDDDCGQQLHQVLKIPKGLIRKRVDLTKYVKPTKEEGK